MSLNERQKQSAELYAQGKNITQIANECRVSRQTIYDDQKNTEWRAEVDRLLTEIKTSADRQIAGNMDEYIKAAAELALKGKSEKVRADMIQYLINRVCGTPSNKQANTTDDSSKDKSAQSVDELRDELARFRSPTLHANSK